jgi:hypothetical protein
MTGATAFYAKQAPEVIPGKSKIGMHSYATLSWGVKKDSSWTAVA